MLSCKDVSENVTDHLEGTSSFLDRILLRLHLLLCQHCRRFVRQFKIAVSVSGRIGKTVDEPSDEDIDDLLRKLKTRN